MGGAAAAVAAAAAAAAASSASCSAPSWALRSASSLSVFSSRLASSAAFCASLSAISLAASASKSGERMKTKMFPSPPAVIRKESSYERAAEKIRPCSQSCNGFDQDFSNNPVTDEHGRNRTTPSLVPVTSQRFEDDIFMYVVASSPDGICRRANFSPNLHSQIGPLSGPSNASKNVSSVLYITALPIAGPAAAMNASRAAT
mmetsp:Transcript_32159/g.73660  ORF Transcript_32159/g.73660 Transcript_32159/m.73660 type:complete len:202 (+) Transcript_32159:2970-3575(+)